MLMDLLFIDLTLFNILLDLSKAIKYSVEFKVKLFRIFIFKMPLKDLINYYFKLYLFH